jgi:glycerol-3-phosphate acyltransferase PlsX
MLVGAMFSIKPIKGVLRPTIASLLPKLNGQTGILVDVGLNADCKPEQLNQFAILGNLYAKHILTIDAPKVGLLNVGEEEGKGNLLAQATYPLLKENTHIQFIGNIEGRDVFNDKADVIVCDGFTGNIILKTAEAMYEAAAHQGLGNDSFFGRFHFENYGGTPVLGVNKPVIIGHGISNAKAFSNMIALAEKMIDTKFCEIITSNFANIL